jgi:hypothetical protein
MARTDPVMVGLDYEALAQGVEAFREMIRANVAAMEADGFTPREARRLVVALFAGHEADTDENED